VRLADCFREAGRANALVLVHNHPAGDQAPSADDVQLTHEVGQAGLLLGIAVVDHVIIAREGFSSLRAEGLYGPPSPSLSLQERMALTPIKSVLPLHPTLTW
jgi:hypothetical protein